MDNSLRELENTERLRLTGRVDSITCREIESLFRNAVMAGKRLIIADMAGVSYVSSAGLRVFLSFQKELKRAGGEICLFGTAPSVYSLFEISGFTGIFRFLSSEDEVKKLLEAPTEKTAIREVSSGRVLLRVLTRNLPVGSFAVIGGDEKLSSAGYGEPDVSSVKATDIRFAAGLAALGNRFEDYKGYFGEAAVIDRSMFVYPALKRSAVDFIIHAEGDKETSYHFLHGFSFQGEFNHIVSFEPKDNLFTLDELIDSVQLASSSPITGITGIFESKGLFGMRLRKIPIRENSNPGEKDIFSGESFPEWMDYSIEAEDLYNLVVITGIAVRDRNGVQGPADRIIPREGRYHIHGIVFDKKPFNKIIDNFPNELRRVVTGMEPQRVLHLLGKTRVGPGLLGITELGG